SWRTRPRIAHLERSHRWHIPRWRERVIKGEAINHRHILQANRYGVASDLQGIIRDSYHPEKAIRQNPRIKVMQSCPQTGVEEVDSYLDECSAGMGTIRGDVFSLVNANICLRGIIHAFVIRGRPVCVCQRCQTSKVRDAVQLRIEPIETRAWKELMDEE